VKLLTDRQISAMIRKIEKHRNAVGKTRDALDEAIAELEGLKDCCDQAWDDLQRARDALSEFA
jgi:predicted translin family RNA/ssDNA-binding protein